MAVCSAFQSSLSVCRPALWCFSVAITTFYFLLHQHLSNCLGIIHPEHWRGCSASAYSDKSLQATCEATAAHRSCSESCCVHCKRSDSACDCGFFLIFHVLNFCLLIESILVRASCETCERSRVISPT